MHVKLGFWQVKFENGCLRFSFCNARKKRFAMVELLVFDFTKYCRGPIFPGVSKKSAKIAAMIETWQGQALDAHYIGFFECFNRQLFYEAHDVLEDLWLVDRKGPNYAYYKGLIQLAGAFVHLQKERLKPSAALFRLAQNNLKQYPVRHDHFNVAVAQDLISRWLGELEENGYSRNPLHTWEKPVLRVEG